VPDPALRPSFRGGGDPSALLSLPLAAEAMANVIVVGSQPAAAVVVVLVLVIVVVLILVGAAVVDIFVDNVVVSR